MVPSIRTWWNETCRFCRFVNQLLEAALRILVLLLAILGIYVISGWYQIVTGWWNDQLPVVEFGIGEVSHLSARPNDVLIFYQPFRKNRNCWGTVRRVLIGECGLFVVSEIPSWIHAPWEGRLTYVVQVPPEAIPGECGFQIMARFVCNPLDLVEPRLVASSPIEFRVLRYDQ
jgi:hypothetical protein